ncbi:MAG TPA: cell division protein ZipA [Wenzhouxiangellaceae bacterium]|nr:cell division protein ZipA [Wenzhouxiangellaceae bacterium]
MENLRLILILIGLGVLAAIWLLHRPEGSSRKPGASRREDARREPFIGGVGSSGRDDVEPSDADSAEDGASSQPRQTTLPDLGSVADEPEQEMPGRTAQGSPTPAAEPTRAARGDVPPEREWRESEPVREAAGSEAVAAGRDNAVAPKIVTLYVRARDDRSISGLSLLDAAIKAGLRFGEMKIFHRRHRGATRPVFSMANITRPGSFDPAGWNLFQTPGVTLFMTLPGPVSALDAWDAMLATGKRLAELLDADLMDDAQCLLTRQRIAQIREDMREFDRKNGLKS